MKKISLIIGFLIGFSTLFGVGYKLDYRWSKPSMDDYEVLAQSVRGMDMKSTQEQIWMLDDRYRGVPESQWKPADVDRYRRLNKYLKCKEEGRKDCEYFK